MVGLGVAEGGGGGPGDYYGEYYPSDQHQYYVPPDMCPHPQQQHPQHAHMCTVHPDYGGMPVVTSATMMPQMLPPQVLDENMRHYLVTHPHAQPHPHHQPHHQPTHHQPPHHQPPLHHQQPHHYGPTNGAGGPQHYYNAGYPAHFHHVPPPHLQHSPPPPVYKNDERAQRQYTKLKKKLEQKNRTNGVVEVNSGASTPSLSPRKEVNGRGGGSGGASSGAWSEGEGSSASASVQGDDDNDTQAYLDMLATVRTPQVSEMTPTSALVQWNSPVPEGVPPPNVELTYDLLFADRGPYKAIYSGPSLSCRVRDLRPGCEYSVCLQIRCDKIDSASKAVKFVAPAAPPDPVSAPRITQRTRSSLQLRWQAPADNGSRILQYVLEMDAGEGYSEVAKCRTRQHSMNGLKPQTRYSFRVIAVNECGRGADGEEVAAWTCGAPPSAPAPPLVKEATATQLTLVWDRRADEEFTLQMDDAARGHGFLPEYTGPETSYVRSGLRRATDYRFRLRAETPDGQGPWSCDITHRTLPAPPGVPSRPQQRGKSHARALRLRWDPPHDDGGATVTQYTLELDAGDGYSVAYSGAEREATCERLQPGASYRARVRASNAAGDGDWSAPESVSTDACAPAACPAPAHAAPPRATLAHVRWQPPPCSGGAPLTQYRVQLADDAEPRLAYCGLDTECVLRDLTPGRLYRVWVVACNRAGAAPPSPALEFQAAPAPPDAPAQPSLQLLDSRSARLEWSPPRDNGAPLLDYRLEMSSSDAEEAFTEIYRGLDTSYTVTNLTPFSAYLFRMCAANKAGRGAWSACRECVTPRAPPAAPRALAADSTPHALQLSWRAGPDHGAPHTHYRVQVDDRITDTDDATCEHTVTGLSPDNAYTVRVAGVSELGAGDWSAEVIARTRPPPPAPPALRIPHAAHNQLRAEWDAATEAATYTVEMRAPPADFRAVYRGSSRSCKIKKLREATTYELRIRASDPRGGRGGWSEAVEARTPPAPPPAPRAPRVELVAGAARAHVSWDALDDAEYVLQCARAKDNLFKQVYAGPEPQFDLDDLESGVEYLLRVCYVRGVLCGAWSGSARLLAPPAPPAPPRPRRPRLARRLQPAHAALLLAAGFLLLAVFVAVLLQRLVERP